MDELARRRRGQLSALQGGQQSFPVPILVPTTHGPLPDRRALRTIMRWLWDHFLCLTLSHRMSAQPRYRYDPRHKVVKPYQFCTRCGYVEKRGVAPYPSLSPRR